MKSTEKSYSRKNSREKANLINERKKADSKTFSRKPDDLSNYDNLTINSQTGSTVTELFMPIKNMNQSSNSIDYIDKVIQFKIF